MAVEGAATEEQDSFVLTPLRRLAMPLGDSRVQELKWLRLARLPLRRRGLSQTTVGECS